MSRIGTKPLKLGKGVTLTASGNDLTIKGPKGTVKWKAPAGIKVNIDGDTVKVERGGNSKHERSCHGLVRSVLENHIQGVQTPFQRILDIQGVGYAVVKKGKSISMKVGFSDDQVVEVPEGLTVDLPSATRIVITGADLQQVGQFAAKVRSVRPPEPYNAKGIKYDDERIQRKAGKSFASAGAGS